MKHVNNFGKEFAVDFGIYDVNTTDDNKKFDRIINPFDLNIKRDYPYKDEEKNKTCFLEIECDNENILVIFKADIIPSFAELYEPYIIFLDDGYIDYDITYNFSVINEKNQLVVVSGISYIILDIDGFNVTSYGILDNVNGYVINLYYKDNCYIVEEYNHLFSVYDDSFKFVKYVDSFEEWFCHSFSIAFVV